MINAVMLGPARAVVRADARVCRQTWELLLVYIYIYVYIYIFIYRERDTHMHIYIYILTYECY